MLKYGNSPVRDPQFVEIVQTYEESKTMVSEDEASKNGNSLLHDPEFEENIRIREEIKAMDDEASRDQQEACITEIVSNNVLQKEISQNENRIWEIVFF